MSLRHRRLARLEAYSGSASEDYLPNPFRRYKPKSQATTSDAKILTRHGSRQNSRPPSPNASAIDITVTSPEFRTTGPVSPGERSNRFILPQNTVLVHSSKLSSGDSSSTPSVTNTEKEAQNEELGGRGTETIWQRWTSRIHALPFSSQDLTTDSRKADRALARANAAWNKFMKAEPAIVVSDFIYEPDLLNTSTPGNRYYNGGSFKGGRSSKPSKSRQGAGSQKLNLV
jgi:hypothetical protein